MGYRALIKRRVLELMGDPRVVRFMQSERFVRAVAKAVELSGRVSDLGVRWCRCRSVGDRVAGLGTLSHLRRQG